MGNKSSSPLPSYDEARANLDDSELRHIKDMFIRIGGGRSGVDLASFVELTSPLQCTPAEDVSSSTPNLPRGTAVVAKRPSNTMRIGLPSVLEKLFAVVDTKKDGVIDYEEYVCVVALFRVGSMEDKVKLLFTMYEPHKSGYLPGTSLKQLIVDALVVSSKELDPQVRVRQAELRLRAADMGPLADCMAEMALHQVGTPYCDSYPNTSRIY